MLSCLCAEALRRSALACAITFEPTRVQLFCKKPPDCLRLTTFAERLALLADFGLDELIVLNLSDPSVRRMGAEEFIGGVLADQLGAVAMCGARTHRIGADAVEWEKAADMARRCGIDSVDVPLVSAGGAAPSSSLIRGLVHSGRLEQANELLGHDFIICGRQQPGEGKGSELGFPTVNVRPGRDKLLPPDGVYAGWLWASHLGRGPLARPHFEGAWPAAINIGVRPTFGGTDRRVEAHVIGLSGRWRLGFVCIGLVRRIREERRFSSVSELREQIAADVRAVAELLG